MRLVDHLKFYLPNVRLDKTNFTLCFGKEFSNFKQTGVLSEEDFQAANTALIAAYSDFIYKTIDQLGYSLDTTTSNLENIKRFFVETSNVIQFDTIIEEKLKANGINPDLEITPPVPYTPEESSIWQHPNGNLYAVLACSNLKTTKLNYLPTVHYRSVHSGETYSKTLNAFLTKMEKHDGTCS